MRTIWVNFLFWIVVLCGGPAMAEATSLEKAAERLFSGEPVEKEWFANQGLASAVPRIVEEWNRELGSLQSVPPCGERCTAIFEQGELHFDMTIDAEGLITTILIDPPVVYSDSLEASIESFTELPGLSAVYVTRNGEAIGSLNGDAPMAVGSAFKLAVLKALNQLIGAGKLEWNQIVELREEWRSVPSGHLQDWPTGAPLTIHTLASLMISVSDNTATDALIDLVTRNSVETISPRNRPFITTREFFQLKRLDMGETRNAYVDGSYDERSRIAVGLRALGTPRVSEIDTNPLLQIEWFFSAKELCALMEDVHTLDVMQINPGLARKEDWQSVSYKGGSDAGVFNLTTGLVAHDGVRYCVSATWNDVHSLDQWTIFMKYLALLHQLK
jgi:beta-lactamase family protein